MKFHRIELIEVDRCKWAGQYRVAIVFLFDRTLNNAGYAAMLLLVLKAIFTTVLAGTFAFVAHWLASMILHSNILIFGLAILTFVGTFYFLMKTTWSQILGNILDGLGSL